MAAEPLDGPAIEWARQLARELRVDLVAGSIVERIPGREKLANTSVHVNPRGEVAAVYRKVHMFDVEIEGRSYRESDLEDPGDEVVMSEIAPRAGDAAPGHETNGGGEAISGDETVGGAEAASSEAGAGIPLGMTICYDLRFPELYRILAVRGARVMAVPAAFTLPTTRDHWEVLLRARAIENQAFMVAANQIGAHPGGHHSGGRSMIVSPWGVVLAQAEDREGHIVADLDLERQLEIRARLPSLANRRPSAYRWPQESLT